MKKIRMTGFLLAAVLLLQSPMTAMASSVSGNGPELQAEAKTGTVSENDMDDYSRACEEVRESLLEILDSKPVYVLLYNTDKYGLKAEPKEGAAETGSVVSGTQLTVNDVAFDDELGVLYLVTAYVNGSPVKGYVEDSNIVTNDVEFNEWKETELVKITGTVYRSEMSNLEAIYVNFPSGYHAALTALSQSHPNWIFVPFHTGLEWSEVLAAQREGDRSLVYRTVDDSWKSKDPGDYDPATGQYVPKSGANWFRASETGVSYCLNPINYLNENNIFAFEQLTYNQSIHNSSGVAAIIANSWMSGRALEDGSGGLYQDVFVEIGSRTGVSPYHLASRVLQEQGVRGDSALISGAYGAYNYFNVKASGATDTEILANGIAYAQSQGWVTRYASILGGAQVVGGNYISKGQDSLYLQKFDVDASYYGLYSHQYMQNIQAPMTESVSVKRAYANAGALDNNYVFKIPVYLNMPGGGTGGGGNVTPGPGGYPVSEEFITQLYSSILGRQPDAEGMEYWKNKMSTGSTAADLVMGFFDSQEMKNRKLTNEQYLGYAYTAILGRNPEPDGKAYWLGELEAGVTRNCILAGFVESAEFTNLCNYFGIRKGSITNLLPADKNRGQTKFVVRLYRNIFNREADEWGLNDWTYRLQNGLTACDILEGFLYSEEFKISNFSNEQYVEILYRTLLGRNADAAGKADWVGRLNAGQSRSQILAGFAYSIEFNDLCREYGIKVGTLTR